MKSQKGFSLLELMATIGIIAIVGAVGLPAIDNFGEQENYEVDVASIKSQINYIRQLSLEEGNAYTLRIVNDTANNSADLEIWQAQDEKRYDVEFHKASVGPCTEFADLGEDQKGTKLSDLTKELKHMTITKCNDVDSATCTAAADNFFCFLPDGSSPEAGRAEIQASSNAGGKKDFLHTYETGFFNIGKRMSE